MLLVFYGFGKINGAQFLVPDAELARPMGEVSGFWLTWYYFGWSTPYKFLIAGTEIIGGLLLFWPRTALLGGVILLPVMLNVVAIDLLFGVDLSGTIPACLILWAVFEVVLPHWARLRAAVLEAPSIPGRLPVAARGGIVAGIVALGLWLGRLARDNIREPTALDGVWRVVEDVGGDSTRTHWRQAFFELNRAYQLNLRAPGTGDAEHHFEVDSAGHLRVWERWLTKGALIGEGQLAPDGHLELTFTPEAGGGRLTLERAPLRRGRYGGNPSSTPP